MSYATRNLNGDNMGNTFVRCPVQNKKKFDANWDRIFGTKTKEQVIPPQGVVITNAGYRDDDYNGLIDKDEDSNPKPHAVPCACYSCRSNTIGDY